MGLAGSPGPCMSDFIANLQFLMGYHDVGSLASVKHDVDSRPHFLGVGGPDDNVIHDLHTPFQALNGDV